MQTSLLHTGALQIDQISKRFGHTEVLRGVSFGVAGGEFVTLLGPSGCGKTTLLRIIAGLEVADAGDVQLGGQPLLHLPANRRPVNTVFQNYALFPHMTVFENVAFGLRARRIAGGEVTRRVGAALALLQIEEFAQRQPHQLSGGQRQRVALARALVNEPDVLLLDEPMSALDAKLRAEVQLELRRLQRKLGKTFILVTHDQDEALTVSDRILVMRAGQIEQAGTPEEVYERPVSRFVAEFLGCANLIPAWSENGYEHGHLDTAFGPLHPAHAPGWRTGTLAIRPERIALHTEQPARNGLRAAVRECVFRGDHTEVFVESAGGENGAAAAQATALRVRTPGARGLSPGDLVWLHLNSEHLHPLKD